jgi:endonuclease III
VTGPKRDGDAPSATAPVILARLRNALPDARIALEFATRWQLLAATLLSAQSTDERVNRVTRVLFARFPDPAATAQADPHELEGLVAELGLFRNKARNLRDAATLIVERHAGEVPATMEALTALPGVGRKTANVVLANGFGIHEGIAVDTHVGRLARRLELSGAEDPVMVERDLMRLFPREDWLAVSDLLIHHGRRTCAARGPACDRCVLEDLCPSARFVGGSEVR